MEKNLLWKLKILGAGSKFDISSPEENPVTRDEISTLPGIYYSCGRDGKFIPVLKILFTNICVYDCEYCENRRSNNIERAIFTPEEIVNLTITLYKSNYIKGLFLSSAIFKDPDTTMEMMLRVIELLRFKEHFTGYIHLKVIPGASHQLIEKAGFLVDRMSVNIEVASERSLRLIAKEKDSRVIFKSMNFMNEKILESIEDSKKFKSYRKKFIPAGQTTQLMVGATPETDYKILKVAKDLYNSFGLKRVYYSAYVALNESSNLPPINSKPPLKRQYRLYQADYLIRFYGFGVDELFQNDNPYLDEEIDPKMKWAQNHPDFFPVEVTSAPLEDLVRVPGIGLKSARRIVDIRKNTVLRIEDLKNIGVILKKASPFIICKGKKLAIF